MQPWDQKVSKGPKETFSTRRINIKPIRDTLRNPQILRIIGILTDFLQKYYFPQNRKWTFRNASGKMFTDLTKGATKYLLVAPGVDR